MKTHTKKSVHTSKRHISCGTFIALTLGLIALLAVCSAIGSILNPATPAHPTSVAVAPAPSLATEQALGIAGDIAQASHSTEVISPTELPTQTPAAVILAELPTQPPTASPPVNPTATDLPPTPSPEPEPYAVASTDLIVRSGPGTGYKQITTLRAGETVQLIATSNVVGWLKHSKGWSNAAFLTTQYQLTKLPIEIITAPPTRIPTKRPPVVRPPTALPPIAIPPTPIPVIVIPPTALPPVIVVQPPPPSNNGCDPNYTPCVPIASDVDCAGGSGNGPAYVEGPVWVIGIDIYRLDTDHDGIGCE